VAAVTLLVVGAITSRFLARPQPLVLRVEGAEMQKDGFVRASPEARPSLRFSDGTRVGLGGVASVRVRSIDIHGAHIAVENGEIRADVIHAPLAAWVFDAGPFVVDVKGTTFSLSWDSMEARLVVRLETGLLAIHTPFTPEPISLQSGQRLVATSVDQRVVVSALSSPDAEGSTTDERAPAASPAEAPPSSPAPVESAVPSAAPGRPSARSAWAEWFASGDFRSIVDDAEQQGLDTSLAQRGLEDLALLADSARYTGQTSVARRALLAQRERFGRSARAIDAAFMLGRLQESTDPDGAARWYDQYLDQAPRGTYAAEALGRKMMIIERLRGAAAARSIAEQYLKKYPRGPHAKSAQTILSSGTPGP
jgi:TolA-binding protein